MTLCPEILDALLNRPFTTFKERDRAPGFWPLSFPFYGQKFKNTSCLYKHIFVLTENNL